MSETPTAENDALVVAIYRQEDGEDIQACTIIEHLAGPKRYARVWDSEPSRVEWGWVLHETSVKVWPAKVIASESIGEGIRTARLARRMTLEQAAEGLCSIAYLSRIERGQRQPNPELLEALATRLQMSGVQYCWCGGEVGPRVPGDEMGLGCLEVIEHDWRDGVDAVALQRAMVPTEIRAAMIRQAEAIAYGQRERERESARKERERIMAIFNEMWSSGDWEGQISIGFASTFDQAVGEDHD